MRSLFEIFKTELSSVEKRSFNDLAKLAIKSFLAYEYCILLTYPSIDKKTKKELTNQLEKMPITTRTNSIRIRKEELFRKLEEIEKAIDMFSKKQVFVKIAILKMIYIKDYYSYAKILIELLNLK